MQREKKREEGRSGLFSRASTGSLYGSVLPIRKLLLKDNYGLDSGGGDIQIRSIKSVGPKHNQVSGRHSLDVLNYSVVNNGSIDQLSGAETVTYRRRPRMSTERAQTENDLGSTFPNLSDCDHNPTLIVFTKSRYRDLLKRPRMSTERVQTGNDLGSTFPNLTDCDHDPTLTVFRFGGSLVDAN